MAIDGTSRGSGAGAAVQGTVVTAGVLASLGSAIALSVSRGRQKLQGISMMGIDETGKQVIPQQAMQWWPETLTDNIAVGWSEKQIPGASHSIMQWGQNGGRSFGFTVKLSRTMRNDSDFSDGTKLVPKTARLLNPSGPRDLAHNVDIKRMLKYLRAYCYPAYTGDLNQARPPVTAILHVPGLGLNEGGEDHVMAVMTACDHTYTKLFPDGTPRLCDVTLGFKQVVQDSTGIHWKGRDVLMDSADIGFKRGSRGIPVAYDRVELPLTPLT